MSLLTVCKCNIANVSESILKKAMENLAKKYNTQLLTSIKDYYGNRQPVSAGFVAPRLDGGIGVRLNDGKVDFVYDPHLRNEYYDNPQKQAAAVKKVKREIEAEIQCVKAQETKAAICRALKKLGFAVDLERKSPAKLLIKGTK